jgi:pimeloyl-ACP methyl ester carboxylesterase
MVGWSDGGVIIYNMAITYPQLVNKAAVIGANAQYEGGYGTIFEFLLRHQFLFSLRAPETQPV